MFILKKEKVKFWDILGLLGNSFVNKNDAELGALLQFFFQVLEGDLLLQPSNQALSHTSVFIFLREVLQAIVPTSVWGSSHNFKVVESFIHKLIDLGAGHTIPIGELLDRMKLKDIR